jgi:hypothetical protein
MYTTVTMVDPVARLGSQNKERLLARNINRVISITDGVMSFLGCRSDRYKK